MQTDPMNGHFWFILKSSVQIFDSKYEYNLMFKILLQI